jgi:predicted GNAT family acetyltransferase
MSSEIVHDETRQRFSTGRDGDASYMVYRRIDDTTVDFVSTYTPRALRGRGIAARVVKRALEWADSEGLRVIPTCWFVAEYVERNPVWRRVLVGAPASHPAE